MKYLVAELLLRRISSAERGPQSDPEVQQQHRDDGRGEHNDPDGSGADCC